MDSGLNPGYDYATQILCILDSVISNIRTENENKEYIVLELVNKKFVQLFLENYRNKKMFSYNFTRGHVYDTVV